MDEETLLHLLRGGHYSMSERIAKGIWPHPPIKRSEIIECITRALEKENWFPKKWEPVEGKAVYEGGLIERRSVSEFIYHNYRHDPLNPYLLAGKSEKAFTSAEEAVRYYLRWDGDLDGWQVVE